MVFMIIVIVIIMIMIRLVDTDHKITMDLEWKQPMRTYGDLKGYRSDKDFDNDHDKLDDCGIIAEFMTYV